MGHPRRYDPLRAFLQAHDGPRVTLRFAEVERIIDARLPVSAYTRGWWRNGAACWTHGRPTPWILAGWRVETANLRPGMEVVTFVRHDAAAPPRA